MAVRIAGIVLPNAKRIEYALLSIYGVGLTTSKKVVSAAKVSPDTRVKDLTDGEVAALRPLIEKQLHVEGDLRREVQLNIKRLKEVGSYRGTRHTRRLPVRGQRTKTNSRTIRGNVRHTMGSGRRSVDKK